MTAKPTNDNTPMVIDPGTLALLQSLSKLSENEDNEPAMEEGFSKTASVKFMITMQDEKKLRDLGYSQAQIEKLKPEEARNLIEAGTKAD